MGEIGVKFGKILFGGLGVLLISVSFTSSYYNFYVLENYKQFTPEEAGYLPEDEIYTCEWGTSTFHIFSNNVDELTYYTHIFPLFISLFIGLFVFLNNRKQLKNIVFLILSVLFALWAYFDLILWASPTPEDVMFFWSAIVPIEMFLYLSTFFLVYLFTRPGRPTFRFLLVCFLLATPTLLLMHTPLNVVGLSPDCDEGAFEGPVISYMYFLEILIILMITYFTITSRQYFSPVQEKLKSFYIGMSTIIFLCFFTAGNLTLMFELGPNYEQYKLIGMPVFAALIAYSIVKFKTFNTKLLGAQALVLALWVLVGSLLLVVKSDTSRIVALVTLVFTTIAGFFLVRSVKKEVKQREQLEHLTQSLAVANEKLKELDKAKSEFVSIASHQLRSPLTAIRGYASMLAEGSFGQMPIKAQESAKRIEESAKLMAMSIEDYLNVSRIESGNMKYNLSDFNLVEMASHLCDDLRPEAMNRNLILLFRSNVAGQGIVNADVGKTNQIIHNLINNSIKYTPKGSVSVFVHDDIKAKKIYIDIIDTGIGMSQETIAKLFGKFSRASNANSVNTSGTGLGLYVALKMAEQMGGTITCTSEGDGKGSTFTFELPLAM
jgi:signal transduction histidine kinase